MTDRDSGKPWSEMDLFDLRNGFERGEPIKEIAAFLMRSIDEVRRKAAELGLATPSASKGSLSGL